VHRALVAAGHELAYARVYERLHSLGMLAEDAGVEGKSVNTGPLENASAQGAQGREGHHSDATEMDDAGAAAPHPAESLEDLSGESPEKVVDDTSAAAKSVKTGPLDNASALEPQGPEGLSSTADDNSRRGGHPQKPVAEAEQALAQAQQQRSAAETQFPQFEHALAEVKARALTAVSAAEVVHAALRRGVLRPEDPEVSAAEVTVSAAKRIVEEARLFLQEARQRATQARQACRQAERRLAEARCAYLLQTEHPALWQQWQALQEDTRQANGSRGDLFRWKWEREQLEQQIAAICAAVEEGEQHADNL
jgi:hypothetical protein